MLTSHSIESLLEPYAAQLGDARTGYLNHCQRVLALSRLIAPAIVEANELEFVVASAFHDLGIWVNDTFDYLDPSVELATRWLQQNGHGDRVSLVSEMILQHHKVRAADGANSAVEIFRRADTVDVTLGLRRFGLSLGSYRALLKEHPDVGFHRGLIRLSLRQLRRDPRHPLPMMRW